MTDNDWCEVVVQVGHPLVHFIYLSREENEGSETLNRSEYQLNTISEYQLKYSIYIGIFTGQLGFF